MNAWAFSLNQPISYKSGLDLQHRLLKARQEDQIPDTILMLQHTPVVTIGNRGRTQYLLKTEKEYADLGIDLVHAERGGDVTFHAPGQWVLYPILYLGGNEADSHGYLFNLEEVAIRTLHDFGIEGFRKEGKSGAWTDQGKIAAIGFRLKRWVSFHGMSFNVNLDLSGFQTIVPCGLVGEPVASLQTILKEKTPTMQDVQRQLFHHFSNVCNRSLIYFDSEGELPPELESIIH